MNQCKDCKYWQELKESKGVWAFNKPPTRFGHCTRTSTEEGCEVSFEYGCKGFKEKVLI